MTSREGLSEKKKDLLDEYFIRSQAVQPMLKKPLKGNYSSKAFMIRLALPFFPNKCV